ncbi:unnamed protein product [Owenia fusiformis]|uniref:PH domain-containing protein n=1 Tax=Owenia fusiformis TaxID=6347 RepID=A0A8S4PW85_OWEFU|nr:unnamed protein product [Owenia fusiformis]
MERSKGTNIIPSGQQQYNRSLASTQNNRSPATPTQYSRSQIESQQNNNSPVVLSPKYNNGFPETSLQYDNVSPQLKFTPQNYDNVAPHIVTLESVNPTVRNIKVNNVSQTITQTVPTNITSPKLKTPPPVFPKPSSPRYQTSRAPPVPNHQENTRGNQRPTLAPLSINGVHPQGEHQPVHGEPNVHRDALEGANFVHKVTRFEKLTNEQLDEVPALQSPESRLERPTLINQNSPQSPENKSDSNQNYVISPTSLSSNESLNSIKSPKLRQLTETLRTPKFPLDPNTTLVSTTREYNPNTESVKSSKESLVLKSSNVSLKSEKQKPLEKERKDTPKSIDKKPLSGPPGKAGQSTPPVHLGEKVFTSETNVIRVAVNGERRASFGAPPKPTEPKPLVSLRQKSGSWSSIATSTDNKSHPDVEVVPPIPRKAPPTPQSAPPIGQRSHNMDLPGVKPTEDRSPTLSGAEMFAQSSPRENFSYNSPHHGALSPYSEPSFEELDNRFSIISVSDIKDEDLTEEQLKLKQKYREIAEQRKQEQEAAQAEQQRLEEILNMCAEYDKQLDSPTTWPKKSADPASPDSGSYTESISSLERKASRIKTNGSFTKLTSPCSPTLSHRDAFIFDHKQKGTSSSASDDEVNDGSLKRNVGFVSEVHYINTEGPTVVNYNGPQSSDIVSRDQEVTKQERNTSNHDYDDVYIPEDETNPKIRPQQRHEYDEVYIPDDGGHPIIVPSDKENKDNVDSKKPLLSPSQKGTYDNISIDENSGKLIVDSFQEMAHREEHDRIASLSLKIKDLEQTTSGTLSSPDSDPMSMETSSPSPQSPKSPPYKGCKSPTSSYSEAIDSYGKKKYPVSPTSSYSKAIEQSGTHLESGTHNTQMSTHESTQSTTKSNENNEPDLRVQIDKLKGQRTESIHNVASLKQQIMEIEAQQNEAIRELEMERALLEGEHQNEMEQLKRDRERIAELKNQQMQLLENAAKQKEKEMADIEREHTKLQQLEAQHYETEQLLDACSQEEEDGLLERYQQEQEALETQRKIYEDLEFHQLERESKVEEEKEIMQRQLLMEQNELVEKYKSREDTLCQIDSQQKEMLNQVRGEIESFEKERQNLLDEFRKEKNKLTNTERRIRDFSRLLTLSPASSTDSDPVKMADFEAELEKIHAPSTEEMIRKIRAGEDGISGVERNVRDSPALKEIEKQRIQHLEKQGGQVIEDQKRRLVELKHRAANEVRQQWEEKRQRDLNGFHSLDSEDSSIASTETTPSERETSVSSDDQLEKVHEMEKLLQQAQNEKVALLQNAEYSPEIVQREGEMATLQMERKKREELEQRLMEETMLREELVEKEIKLRDGQRKQARPLTRYLPIRSKNFDLHQHIETAGHHIEACPFVHITEDSCRGFLQKMGSKFKRWNKRWFVFDRKKRSFLYYSDKNEVKPRGGIYFQAIEEVYVDHLKSVKSPNQKLTFCVKTYDRTYFLVAPSPEAMRIWIDVIFTGAEGYSEYNQS